MIKSNFEQYTLSENIKYTQNLIQILIKKRDYVKKKCRLSLVFAFTGTHA